MVRFYYFFLFFFYKIWKRERMYPSFPRPVYRYKNFAKPPFSSSVPRAIGQLYPRLYLQRTLTLHRYCRLTVPPEGINETHYYHAYVLGVFERGATFSWGQRTVSSHYRPVCAYIPRASPLRVPIAYKL